ncbi:MAG: FAD-dependent oxidoreductase [Deltaproteobacteria bacterium]|jgi:formate dehydrogenase major subunit|nr:FAD-dependent oxidoreductase [Deltaproteobacteria bacterium]
MKSVKIEVNGQNIEAEAGQTILQVVQDQGLDEIPTLCHSPELKPYGSCFVCVVELEGRANLVPSCATVVADGMKIKTNSDKVIDSRRVALELLLSNHYADCVSPCSVGCPAGVDIQGYVALASMGEYKKAADLIRERNPFPAACGRVCVRKCEVACRRADVDESININDVKRYLSDMPEIYKGEAPSDKLSGKKVGIVGGGPAGLTAAWFLRKKGYETTIYEALSELGGMLRYGIPAYRLPDEDLDRDIDYIVRTGVKVHCGMKVGRDLKLDNLMHDNDAVFVAAGAMGGKAMRVEGEFDTDGVVTGVDFLLERSESREPVSGTIVVVGGGNTAMDVARSSWRLGADKVIILYRRTKNEMPADKHEIEDCLDEGIEIMELVAPVGIVKEGNKLKAMKCIRMKLGEPDASGRRSPKPLEGSEFDLPCDLAVSAIGQTPVLDDMLEGSDANGLGLTKWKTIEIDQKSMKTNIEGLFAGGDVADDGPTVVIDAIRDGRKAAMAIHEYISGEKCEPDPFAVMKEFWVKPGQTELGEVKEGPRRAMNQIDVEDRSGNFDEVATGYEFEDVSYEAGRCLTCGCVSFDWCNLRKYAEQYKVDMERFKGDVRKFKIDDRHPYIVYDPNKCILCGRCVRTCEMILPIGALGLVNRGFMTEMRPAMNDPLVDTSCVACGNCVDTCPVGALTIKYPFPGRACIQTETSETHCGICSVGCKTRVKSFGGDNYFIESGEGSGDYLCFRGRFSNELFINNRRLVNPSKRDNLNHESIKYQEAYEGIAKGLKAVADKHGPESVAVFISSDSSCEEMYIASKIARDGLGTNNIASLEMLATGVPSGVLDKSFGFTASTADRDAIRNADLIICNNTDLQNDQLVLGIEVVNAVKERGAKLLLSNSSENPLDLMASLKLSPFRGKASLLWNGIIQKLIDDGILNRKEVEKIAGGKDYLADEYDYSLSSISKLTGEEGSKIEKAVNIIKGSKRVSILHCVDRTRDSSHDDLAVFANLVILLRTVGVEANLMLVYQASNAAGLELSGADPAYVMGRKPVKGFAGAKSRTELLDMLKGNNIKGALLIGEDPMRHDSTSSWFSGVDFLAVVDWAETESALHANIAVPCSTSLESEGTRVNFEGKVSEFKPAILAPNNVKKWHVLNNIAGNLGVEVSAIFSQISKGLASGVKKSLGNKLPYYWNFGERKGWDGSGSLVVADVASKPAARAPTMTEVEQYKQEVLEVGIANFRVGSRKK